MTFQNQKCGGKSTEADVVVAAVGKAAIVKGHWIRATVIDVGMNSVDIVPAKEGGKSYKLVGDVDFASAESRCSKITPVSGGVGLMTVAMLLRNTLLSCEQITSKIK